MLAAHQINLSKNLQNCEVIVEKGSVLGVECQQEVTAEVFQEF
jgi:hypothetical protein